MDLFHFREVSPIRESVVSRREYSKVPFVDIILYNLWRFDPPLSYKLPIDYEIPIVLNPFVSLSELCLILS